MSKHRASDTFLWSLSAVLVAAMTIPAHATLPDPDGQPADMSKPVQVFIMMGQSNMLGYGRISGGVEGRLDYAVGTKGLYPYLQDDQGAWTQRNDVRYTRVQGSGGQTGTGVGTLKNNHWLNVGLDGDGSIGVEQGIGHHLGQAIDAPVLLLKSAIGNRALGWDLLPPGGAQYDHSDGYTYPGSGGSPERWVTGTTPTPISWYAGLQYEGDVKRAHNVLANIGTYYPGATQYEVAGFFWWQGDRDRYSAGHADMYEQNLVRLIDSLRTEFNAPNAPFVLATLGQTAIGAGGNDGTILDAMLAVDGDAGNYPDFVGNVATVYSHPLSLGGASNSHYNNHAETYMNVGQAMGEEMVGLIPEPTTLALLGLGGAAVLRRCQAAGSGRSPRRAIPPSLAPNR
jgi:hypothetical protein